MTLSASVFLALLFTLLRPGRVEPAHSISPQTQPDDTLMLLVGLQSLTSFRCYVALTIGGVELQGINANERSPKVAASC